MLGQRSIYTTTTLKIPQSLTRHPTTTHHQDPPPAPNGPNPSRPPVSQGEVSDTGSALGLALPQESYREIKCCFSVTIRRDAWGVPVAIMGQWIVSTGTGSPRNQSEVGTNVSLSEGVDTVSRFFDFEIQCSLAEGPVLETSKSLALVLCETDPASERCTLLVYVS
jgi:hypothetical protein